jgi:tryptophan-rich sensory protein
LSIVFVLALSWLSSLPVRGDGMLWYGQLQKPFFTPPSWSFGVVWPILYVLMTVAAWLVWRKRHSEEVGTALIVFVLQLSINLVWSYLFFGLRSPVLGFGWILVLLPLAVLTYSLFRQHSRAASLLLLPYLAWTSFALLLAGSIWRLN